MTKTSLLHSHKSTTNNLKALDSRLDRLSLTALITKLIHNSLTAAKSVSVSLDGLLHAFGNDSVCNRETSRSEELDDFSVVSVVFGLVDIALQRSEQLFGAGVDCESPGAGITARQVDVVFIVFEVIEFGGWEGECNAAEVVDVFNADKSEPFVSLTIETKLDSFCVRLRLQIQEETVYAVEGGTGFLSDLAVDRKKSRKRVLDVCSASAQSVAVDQHADLFGQIQETKRTSAADAAKAQCGDLKVVHDAVQGCVEHGEEVRSG